MGLTRIIGLLGAAKAPGKHKPWERWAGSRGRAGGHSLLRTANSSSEGLRSGLRFGSSFFMVLGLLLRS